MTKTTAERGGLAALLLFAALSSSSAAPAPPAPGGRVPEYEASLRLLGRWRGLEPMAEAAERWQYHRHLPSRSLMLGSYGRVARHLKLGAFYRLQYGARHDDDWTRDSAGFWGWRDVTRRPEHVLLLDASPRVALGGQWVASLKTRLEHNFFNDENILKVQPELAWFWMNGLTPRATLFLRQETDFPLDFGQTTVWGRWYYLAGLWHARPGISLGPSIALREEVWSTSTEYHSVRPRAPGYQTLYRAWVAGFTVLGRW